MIPSRIAGAILVLTLGGNVSADENWTVPTAEKARVNLLRATEKDLSRGRSLYLQHCALCHGDQGRGDGPSARLHARKARPPQDLTRPEIQANMTDGEIFWKIGAGFREGKKIVMPSFENEIASADDRWRVVMFVRSLEAKPTP